MNALDPAIYSGDEFFQLMAASVHLTGGAPDAMEVFVAWAKARRAAYQLPRKMGEVRRRWRSVAPGRVTIGTFRHYLRAARRDDLVFGLNQLQASQEQELFLADDVETMDFQLDRARLALTDAAAAGGASNG